MRPASRHFWLLPILSLWKREIVRFYRQRNRIVGAIGSPLVFWIFLGAGLSGSFRVPGADSPLSYTEYFFPGIVAMTALFTSIFSTISIIEDRREGFLQGVLVAPVPRSAIILGKVLGGATLSTLQGMLFLLLAPFLHIEPGPLAILASLASLWLLSFSLTAFGMLIAWPMESTQGFHAIMNILLFPMWMLSGALFPASGAPGWLRVIMTVNPMTYGLGALRHALYLGKPFPAPGPGFALSLAVTGLFGLASLAGATLLARRRTLRGLP